MKTCAIIPARGGSKGIPRKNVRLLVGKPLLAHTIEQAHAAAHVQRVIVSTDDAEIAAVAQHYGADVVWRPAEISGDGASSESALLHTLDFLCQSEGYVPDLVVFLQCTAPLTLAEDIDGTVQALLDADADTALAATPFHYFLWRTDPTGDSVGINHDKRIRLLRQDREPQYRETGAVYVMRTSGFLAARHRFFGKTAMYIVPPERCLEIDDPVDFEVAEVLLRDQQRHHIARQLPDPIGAIVFDFDGVFTDNKVIVGQDGNEAVVCDRSDGWGVAQLKRHGIPLLVLSTEVNPVVQARCDKLDLPCRRGLDDKVTALHEWLAPQGIPPSQIIYVGNDVNDLACMATVGCGVAVADAHPALLPAARLVLNHRGGQGAIRELADIVIQLEETRRTYVPA